MLRALKDKKGQGTAEYILIMALVIGLGYLLWQQIQPRLQNKISATATVLDQTGH